MQVGGLGEADGEGQAQPLAGGFGDQGAQAGGAGGDRLSGDTAGAGAGRGDEDGFASDAGAGAGGGGAPLGVAGGDDGEFGQVGDAACLDGGQDLAEGGDEGCAFVLGVELRDQGGVAVDDAGDVAFGVAGLLESVGEVGGFVERRAGGWLAASGGIRCCPMRW